MTERDRLIAWCEEWEEFARRFGGWQGFADNMRGIAELLRLPSGEQEAPKKVFCVYCGSSEHLADSPAGDLEHERLRRVSLGEEQEASKGEPEAGDKVIDLMVSLEKSLAGKRAPRGDSNG